MEITRKKHEEAKAELEEVKKDVLGMVSTEEEVVKELEAIELEIKAAEKFLKSKIKDIDAAESRVFNEEQTIQALND